MSDKAEDRKNSGWAQPAPAELAPKIDGRRKKVAAVELPMEDE
tara:strand:+ start:3257 stop:3385 length:129 start_codon:yes stop_codon:yes gene_type:complete